MTVASEALHLWQRSVNCSADQIEAWHATRESRSVGSRRPGDRWSVGQLAGQRTVELLQTPTELWDAADVAHVRRVAGFVRRHRAQWPRGDVRLSRWRHSLRNWGHDPLWEGRLRLLGDDAPDRHDLVVDDAVVGEVVLFAPDDGSVVVERIAIDQAWRGRGLGSALLHHLAVAHQGRVEVVLPDAPDGVVDLAALAARRHLVAPMPGEPVLRLHGW